MTQVLEYRNPTPAEMFQGLAAALVRLGGKDDATAAAIQEEVAADTPDFKRAADAIGVKLDDLVDVFCAEMLDRGFIIRRRWTH